MYRTAWFHLRTPDQPLSASKTRLAVAVFAGPGWIPSPEAAPTATRLALGKGRRGPIP